MEKITGPVFIIGAGRSGTNILRDSLASLENLVTWPCDEINLVFRHGNREMKHDEFGRDEANAQARKYITRSFAKLQSQSPGSRVLEKTCANSLRVPFLRDIFPDAKFIFIVRNGYDVTASAVKRWKAPIEIGYLWKKLRYVPVSDVPFYAIRFIENRLEQIKSREKKQGIWGPVYKGMRQDALRLTLAELAAKQWAKCVDKAFSDLDGLPLKQVYVVAYEQFVKSPFEIVEEIRDWLGESWSTADIKSAVKEVRGSSVDKGRAQFAHSDLKRISGIIDPIMERIYDTVAKGSKTGI